MHYYLLELYTTALQEAQTIRTLPQFRETVALRHWLSSGLQITLEMVKVIMQLDTGSVRHGLRFPYMISLLSRI